jgi:hypothetical protein
VGEVEARIGRGTRRDLQHERHTVSLLICDFKMGGYAKRKKPWVKKSEMHGDLPIKL